MVVLVPEFGALLLVSVVVVDWDDFSDAAGRGRRTFSALRTLNASRSLGRSFSYSFLASGQPPAPEAPSRNAMAAYAATLLSFLCMEAS